MIDEKNVAKIQKAGKVAVILASSLGAMAILRSLGRNKIPCIVIGDDFHHKSIYTTVALEAKTNEELINLLIRIPKIVAMKPVLFTDADAYLEIVFSNWSKLENEYHLPTSLNNYNLVNKEYIEKIEGIHTVVSLPVTLKSIGEIKDNYPVIIKPLSNSSKLSKVKKEPEKAYICRDFEEVQKVDTYLQQISIPYVLQHLIEGGSSTNYSALLYRNALGKIEVGYTVKKLRIYPLRFGLSTFVISENNSELLKRSIAIMELMDFQGIGEFEYKYCEKTKTYILLEVNGRFPLPTAMLLRNNPQFIYTVFCDLIENSSSDTVSDKSIPNVYWTFLLNDLRAIKAENNTSIFKVILKACFSLRIQGAIWSIIDPLPALYYDKFLAKKLLRKLILTNNPDYKKGKGV